MTMWPGLAILVLILVAGGIAGVLLLLRALARFEPDDAEARRRARRRDRLAITTYLVAVPLVAALWIVGSPGDLWWALAVATVLEAIGLAALVVARRRWRATSTV